MIILQTKNYSIFIHRFYIHSMNFIELFTNNDVTPTLKRYNTLINTHFHVQFSTLFKTKRFVAQDIKRELTNLILQNFVCFSHFSFQYCYVFVLSHHLTFATLESNTCFARSNVVSMNISQDQQPKRDQHFKNTSHLIRSWRRIEKKADTYKTLK